LGNRKKELMTKREGERNKKKGEEKKNEIVTDH